MCTETRCATPIHPWPSPPAQPGNKKGFVLRVRQAALPTLQPTKVKGTPRQLKKAFQLAVSETRICRNVAMSCRFEHSARLVQQKNTFVRWVQAQAPMWFANTTDGVPLPYGDVQRSGDVLVDRTVREATGYTRGTPRRKWHARKATRLTHTPVVSAAAGVAHRGRTALRAKRTPCWKPYYLSGRVNL